MLTSLMVLHLLYTAGLEIVYSFKITTLNVFLIKNDYCILHGTLYG